MKCTSMCNHIFLCLGHIYHGLNVSGKKLFGEDDEETAGLEYGMFTVSKLLLIKYY